MSENNTNNYKKYYNGIFSLNYLTQGINQSMFAIIIPIYLILTLKSIEISSIIGIISIGLMPWSMKFLYGIINDKFGSKKLGRRKPYVIFPSIVSGICWILIPLLLYPSSAIALFTIMAVIINLGYAITDTSIDGLIMDIVPKAQLGSSQGLFWGVRTFGLILGGPIFAFLLTTFSIDFIFITLGFISIFFSLLIIFIKEDISKQQIKLTTNLKIIFKTRENWKVFLFSMFLAIIDGIVYLILALYVLIKIGLIKPEGAKISLLKENIDLYLPQAYITSIIGIGIILGAIIGGYLADRKSRRFSIYISYLIISVSFVLLILPVPIVAILVFCGILGCALGWRNGAVFAILGNYSKRYPEIDSTYFSICMAFSNLGTILGLTLTGFLFTEVANISSDFLVIYGTVFIFMAFLQNIGLLFFKLLDPNEYEYKLAKK